MYKEHPVFEKPRDENAAIWRYLDFTKFVSLLDKKALFFSRADKLEDPFEGSYSKANVKMRPEVYKDIPPNKLLTLVELYKELVSHTFISCWHLSEHESAAMWKLYLKSNDGIAIRSTFGQLKRCFSDENRNIYIGRVKYIDYENDWMPEGNALYPFVHKRRSFEHEQELRAVIQEFSFNSNGGINLYKPLLYDGIYIQVDLDVLLDRIYVAPTSPQWLLELVKSVTRVYGLDKEVLQSVLDDVPVY